MIKRKKWSKKDDIILKKHYPKSSKKDLMDSLPGRTWDAIKIRAGKFKIKREVNDNRNCDLTPLLKDENISYYWIGFLLADGYFEKDRGRIILTISPKDHEHICKFSSFVSIDPKTLNKTTVSVMHKEIVDKIRKKFSIRERKSYNPPGINIWNMKDDLFLSLFIGYVDGDGSIGKQYKRDDSILRIKCHSSWIEILQEMSNKIYGMAGSPPTKPYIDGEGYVNLNISRASVLRFIKKKTLELALPYLERKWSNIDLGKISRTEMSGERKKRIFELLEDGKTRKEISEEVGVSGSYISQLKNRRQKDDGQGGT